MTPSYLVKKVFPLLVGLKCLAARSSLKSLEKNLLKCLLGGGGVKPGDREQLYLGMSTWVCFLT